MVPRVEASVSTDAFWPGGLLSFAQVGDRALFDHRGTWYAVPDQVSDQRGSGIDVLLDIRSGLRRLPDHQQDVQAVHRDSTESGARPAVMPENVSR